MTKNPIRFRIIDSPLGKILVAGSEAGICRLNFQEGTAPLMPARDWEESTVAFQDVEEQLSAYFAGERRSFDLALTVEGTPFQRLVWNRLRQVPYGSTISYAALARSVGNPRSARAVGAANGANPVPIIIPCHRIVGADGSLTGFRGGIELKRRLIELERAAAEV